jgi:hypothetical protein
MRRNCIRAFLVALFSAATLLTIGISAQRIVEPTIGQPGKDAVWVPTSPEMVEKMLDMAQVTPQDFVMDLGSGDGRTVIAAAKRGARALGVEYNNDLVELSCRTISSAFETSSWRCRPVPASCSIPWIFPNGNQTPER